MKVPLLDLGPQYQAIKHEVDEAIQRVISSQRFILGPEVERCERAVADYCGCAHGVGVSSGTDALLIALMAEQIGPGDEVITTPYSFFATAGVIARLGAKPVFADIDPITFNLKPDRVEERITKRSRAIIPVHLFGQMTEMAPLMQIAERHGLVVIEDAAQAIGAEHQGHLAGSIGHYGCFSFFPSKNLGAFGDGGMVVTNDAERATTLRALRMHGEERRYHHRTVGGNFRLDAIQAAVVSAKLPHLAGWVAARQRNAARYGRMLTQLALGAGAPVKLPQAVTGSHVFNQYVVRIRERDQVKAQMEADGVGTAIYYPLPLHLQECFQGLGYKTGDLPVSERAAQESLALPVYPELSEEQIDYVAGSLARAVRG